MTRDYTKPTKTEEFVDACFNFDNDEEPWVDVECDGCCATLGALPESEISDKELYLCTECKPEDCAYTRLEQVDPVKYADEIAKQKEACKPTLMTMCQVCKDKGQDTDCDSCVPF